MITFILIFFVAVITIGLLSVLGFAAYLKRRRKSLEIINQEQFNEPPPYRPLFAPTDVEIRALEREEEIEKVAEAKEAERRITLEKTKRRASLKESGAMSRPNKTQSNFSVLPPKVLICHIHLPEELMKTQTEKILAEQKQGMFNAQREAEIKRIELEKTSSQADNQRSLMEATVGVEISAKRSEQRKPEAEGEAYYISETGKAEAEKMRLIGEAQGVAYNEQVNALGANGVALIETLKVIGEKGVRITPDIMASGGNGNDGGTGGIGTLLLLNLFRDQLQKNGDKPVVAATNGDKS